MKKIASLIFAAVCASAFAFQADFTKPVKEMTVRNASLKGGKLVMKSNWGGADIKINQALPIEVSFKYTLSNINPKEKVHRFFCSIIGENKQQFLLTFRKDQIIESYFTDKKSGDVGGIIEKKFPFDTDKEHAMSIVISAKDVTISIDGKVIAKKWHKMPATFKAQKVNFISSNEVMTISSLYIGAPKTAK